MSEIKDKLITAENLKNAYNDNKRQIGELKGDLAKLAYIEHNLISAYGYTENIFLGEATSGLSTTNAIPVSIGDVITLHSVNNGSGASGASGAYRFYSSTHYSLPLSETIFMNENPTTLTITCDYNGYLRFGFYTDYVDECYVKINSKSRLVDFTNRAKDLIIKSIGKNSITSENINGIYDLFTIKDSTDGKYLDANGNEAELGGFSHTDYIEVSPNTKYEGYFKSNNDQYIIYLLCLYDENKNLIRSLQKNDSLVTLKDNYVAEVTTDANTKYIRMNYYTSYASDRVYLKLSGVERKELDWLVLNEKQVNSVLQSLSKKNAFYGKTMTVLGDSITNGYGTTKRYWEYLKEKLNLTTVNNNGINGSSIAQGQNPMCERVASIPSADIILVFGGTNDFGVFNVPLGEQYTLSGTTKVLNKNTNTFYGALNTLCESLITRFSDKFIIFCTPIHREKFESQPTDREANTIGKYLDDYVEAIRTVCNFYGIMVEDLHSRYHINPNFSNVKTVYFNDGIHPNAKGHEKLADILLHDVFNKYI